MARKFTVRDDFEPLFYDELGRLVVAAGRIEYVLKLCIKSLVKMEDKDKTFTDAFIEAEELSKIPALCEKAKKLANDRLGDDQKKPFCVLVDKIRELTSDRNDMIHAAWTTDDCRTPLRVRPERIGPRGSRKVGWSKTKIVPLNTLRSVRRQLDDAYNQLQCQRKNWN